MDEYEQKLGIKFWAEEDRPREKLLQHGRRHLTNAELVAILIGSGSVMESAVDLSKRILAYFDHNLTKLGKASIEELSTFKGIGEAKAISIIAALELGLRRKETDAENLVKISSSKDIFGYLQPVFADLNHEEFWVILLNRANGILGKYLISKGGQAGTVADPKIIFHLALEKNAAGIILAHNHPSGNLLPSEADNRLTKNLVEAGKLLYLYVLDHLIFAGNKYYSYKDEDLI